MKPFANESESLELHGLTIENRTDRVSVFGSIDLTLDKQGLAAAKELSVLLSSIIAVMESSESLPDRITLLVPDEVDNPFL